MNGNQYEKLFEIAFDNLNNSYSPYSNFKVSAVLVTTSDEIFKGVNVENVSFGATMCAERSAVFTAVSNGKRDFKEIFIVSDSKDVLPIPCGLCLQVLSEFNDGSMMINVGNRGPEEKFIRAPLKSFLPQAFGK